MKLDNYSEGLVRLHDLVDFMYGGLNANTPPRDKELADDLAEVYLKYYDRHIGKKENA